jgi:fructokinase
MQPEDLSLQSALGIRNVSVAVLGEVIWDILPEGSCLGGAPLNFAVHLSRLGYEPLIISAVGTDEFGEQALVAIERFGLATTMIQTTGRWPTGTASVQLDSDHEPTFTIHRPAAYDALHMTAVEIDQLRQRPPAWLYYGTLFASTPEGKVTLLQLLDALPNAKRFYDVNLRPGFATPALVLELVSKAAVIKLNEAELAAVSDFGDLPSTVEKFCTAGVERFGWNAVCVTMGARGCAILAGGEYAVADGHPVVVADSIGAGDAFAAAFLHGLTCGWPAQRVAEFANRVGAMVASRVGAIPEWSLEEAAEL